MKSYNHCKSSVKYFGGNEDDYYDIHSWFDRSKNYYGDIRHRALRHHTQGIEECEYIFGYSIKNSDGKEIPVRSIAEQHIREDLGFIPSVQDWLKEIVPKPWMSSTKKVVKKMNLM
tara:strand:- start:1173 stop:1520 length:348 start_codon:yes stop_codon:yes gene_type:complete